LTYFVSVSLEKVIRLLEMPKFAMFGEKSEKSFDTASSLERDTS